MKRCVQAFVLLFCTALFGLETQDPPDSEVNPQSGDIETVDPIVVGSNQDIRYVVDHGISTTPDIETVTENALDDRNPRLVISTAGDAWVVWWRDDTVDKVLSRRRDLSEEAWDDERVLSLTSESSSHPAVVHDGTDAWVAYEYLNGTDISIGVATIIDEPDPVDDRIEVASTGFSGEIDVMIHAESGHLWVTWVDSSTYVGWVEYDYTNETWSSAATESYAADTVAEARERIRDEVLGL